MTATPTDDFLAKNGVIPGDEAFRPLAEGGCPLVTAAGK